MLELLTTTAYAAKSDIDLSSFGSFTGSLTSLVYNVTGILLTVALAVFFWRIVVSIYKVGSSSKAVEDGKKLLFWGVVALFVVVSMWGIVSLLSRSVFDANPGIPQLGKR